MSDIYLITLPFSSEGLYFSKDSFTLLEDGTLGILGTLESDGTPVGVVSSSHLRVSGARLKAMQRGENSIFARGRRFPDSVYYTLVAGDGASPETGLRVSEYGLE